MSRRQTIVVLAFLVCESFAAADERWTGQRVIIRHSGVVIGFAKEGEWKSLGTITELAVSVLEERGDWLLVRAGSRVGWIPRLEAIPVKEAVDHYTKSIGDEPHLDGHYLRRGTAYLESGRFEDAIRDFTEVIRLDAQSHVALNGRAVARHLSKRYAEALGDYAQAARIAPNDAHTFANRAWLLATCPDQQFRDGKKAVADGRKACELTDWKDADCVENLAAALAEDGQFDEAVTYQKKALAFPRFQNENGAKARERIKLYEAHKPYRTDGGD